jgi:molecular chaperone DnaJ
VGAKCDACFGEGRVLEEEIIPIKIPSGVSNDMQLSMSGKGNVPPRGGIAGDLLIVIEEEEHEVLHRDGNNVIFDLYVSFVDAALGTSVEVPTITGKAKITLEAGTQSGKILRLKGKGIKELNGYSIGDQLVHVNIWTPKQLTSEESALLEKLRNSANFAPQPSKSDKGFFHKVKDMFS